MRWEVVRKGGEGGGKGEVERWEGVWRHTVQFLQLCVWLKTRHKPLVPRVLVPVSSPSRGGNVTVYVSDINQPSLPTPFCSVLVSISVFMALSTVFHSTILPTLYFLTLFLVSWWVVCAACCHMALVFLLCFFFFCFCPFLFVLFKKKSGGDKSTEWSTIPECPSLMCFCKQGWYRRD